MRRELAALISALACTITTPACSGSAELSRSKATQLIRSSGDFKQHFWTIDFCFGSCLMVPSQAKIIETLESLGYLQVQPHPWFSTARRLSLTEKGDATFKNLPVMEQGAEWTIVKVRLWQAELLDITGILKERPNASKADFTWRWSNPTSIANILVKAGVNEVTPQGTHEGTARFTLYDDGWRVTGIYFSPYPTGIKSRNR